MGDSHASVPVQLTVSLPGRESLRFLAIRDVVTMARLDYLILSHPFLAFTVRVLTLSLQYHDLGGTYLTVINNSKSHGDAGHRSCSSAALGFLCDRCGNMSMSADC